MARNQRAIQSIPVVAFTLLAMSDPPRVFCQNSNKCHVFGRTGVLISVTSTCELVRVDARRNTQLLDCIQVFEERGRRLDIRSMSLFCDDRRRVVAPWNGCAACCADCCGDAGFPAAFMVAVKQRRL